MSRRHRKSVPTCEQCGSGILWLTLRGNRVPFDRMPVDVDELEDRIAQPCCRGEAWALDDLLLELQAFYHWTPTQARQNALEQIPWHVPHHCPTEPQEVDS